MGERDNFHTLREGAEKKLLGLLGFAARARKLISGADLSICHIHGILPHFL